MPLMSVMPLQEPVIMVMSIAMISTAMVRSAVATVESVLRIPHFARIEVNPAKNADPAANTSHIKRTSFE